MERDSQHNVDVIKSRSGVKVYSQVNHDDLYLKRNLEEFDSFADAQNKITGELRTEYIFLKIYSTMAKAEKLALAIVSLKNVITYASNTSGGIDKDVLPILGIMGLYIITNIAKEINTNNLILAQHKLEAVKEAGKLGDPQFKQSFSLNTDKN